MDDTDPTDDGRSRGGSKRWFPKLPLGRRDALAGLLGLSLLGSDAAGASRSGLNSQPAPPARPWNQDVDARGHRLFDLGSLAMRANPTEITDFEGSNLSIDASGVLNATDTDTDTRTDVSDGGGVVVADAADVTFTASGSASVAVTDDGDGTATVEVGAVDTDTDTRTDVSDDGTQITADVEDIDFASGLSVGDDGDGSATVSVDAAGISHDDLADVSTDDHHARYTDAEAVAAVNAEPSLDVDITGSADLLDGLDASDLRVAVTDDGSPVEPAVSTIDFGTNLAVAGVGSNAVTVDASGASPWDDADSDGLLEAPGFRGVDVETVEAFSVDANVVTASQINRRVQAAGFASVQQALREAYETGRGSVIEIPPGTHGPVTPFPGQTLVGAGAKTIIEGGGGAGDHAIDLTVANTLVGDQADDVTLERLAVRANGSDANAVHVGADQQGLVMSDCRVLGAADHGVYCDGTACVFTGNVFSSVAIAGDGIHFDSNAEDCVATGNADVGTITPGTGNVVANNT